MASRVSAICCSTAGGSSVSLSADRVSSHSAPSSPSFPNSFSMEATPDDRVLSHPSSRAPDRTHAFSISSMTDAGPSIPSRRPVSSSSSVMCAFSFSKSSPIDPSSSSNSVLVAASLRVFPMAAARSGISATGIGIGSGTGVGAGVAAGSWVSCARTVTAGARPTTNSTAISASRLINACLCLIGVILRAPCFVAIAIAIAIAIENPPTRSISSRFANKGGSFARIPVALNIIPHRISPTPKLRQHRRYSVEGQLRILVFLDRNSTASL